MNNKDLDTKNVQPEEQNAPAATRAQGTPRAEETPINKASQQATSADAPDIADTAEVPETSGAPDAADASDKPKILSAEEQLAAVNDQLLRALAELENTRRRAERERSEALKYGAMAFARDMLSVVDNLQRALKAVKELTDDALPETATAMLEGVAATERDLLTSLQRHKVTPIPAMGEKFNPNLHEAMFETPSTDQPAGTVIEEIETGYVMGDRLLRPAKVGIAKD